MTPFDQWWAEYPRKVSKIPARLAYAKAAKLVGHRALLSTIKAYRAATNDYKPKDRRFIPYPASWLNAGKYDDDQAEWVDAEQVTLRAKLAAEKQRFRRIQEDSDRRRAEDAAIEAKMQTPECIKARRKLFADFSGGLTSSPKDVP